jgi:hypothetical protein
VKHHRLGEIHLVVPYLDAKSLALGGPSEESQDEHRSTADADLQNGPFEEPQGGPFEGPQNGLFGEPRGEPFAENQTGFLDLPLNENLETNADHHHRAKA